MATRHLIERLSGRTDALVERLRPPGRTFVVYVRNHLNEDEEIAAFRKEHGVTDNDMLIVVVFIPYKRRPGETAAYERELREAGRPGRALDLRAHEGAGSAGRRDSYRRP
jgi:hypothetical protein